MSFSRTTTLLLVSCCLAGCAQQTRYAQPPSGAITAVPTLPPTPNSTPSPAPASDQDSPRLDADGKPLPAFGEYVHIEELPEAIVRVAPRYPDDWGKGVEGTVMVQALVLRDGTVGATRIVKSIPMLDEAAAASVRQWRFKPAMAKGQPVAVWVAVPVKFTLH